MADSKKKKHKGGARISNTKSRSTSSTGTSQNENTTDIITTIFSNKILGIIALCVCGYIHAYLMYTFHENRMWFTNIKEVEREISFRTESGLYYSYYKQLVKSPSLFQGIHELMNDNQTEHPSVINILARMNIYQEVVLAFIYKAFAVKMLPIFFYIIAVFFLHGLLVGALFTMSWVLTGTWLSGVLTAGFYIVNRIDTTRVSYSIPLREHFSIPFLWIQFAAMVLYFQPRLLSDWKKKLLLSVIAVSTFLFAVTWQFNQFIFLLQVSSLFGVYILGMVPLNKVRTMLHIILVSMLLVWFLQFMNNMILVSLAVGLIIASYIIMYFKGEVKPAQGVIRGIVTTAMYSVLVLVMASAITALLKIVLQVDADDHIFQFLKGKFNLGYKKDFDSQLYLCLGAFNFLTFDTYERLTSGVVFPLYVVYHGAALLITLVAVIQNFRKPGETKTDTSTANGKTDRGKGQEELANQHLLSSCPEIAFIAIQSLIFGLLAMSTLRMKFIWTPVMCVMGSILVADKSLWAFIASKFQLKQFINQMFRNSALIVVVAVLFSQGWPSVNQELNDLREFWDPDTVELMEWIQKDVPKTSSFTGSMQLLAGVKLCSERPITNHPHYEDKVLRLKTRELYQIYGRWKPEDVSKILKKHKSNYIILEDSICRAPSDGCRTPDLMDYENGEVADNDIMEEGLVHSHSPRFCEQIRHDQPEYTKYFKKVFENRTFRVHQVL